MEFALVMPLMLFLLLAVVGYGMLHVSWHGYQTAVTTLTELAALDPNESWRSKVKEINDRWHCALVGSVDVAYPDGNKDPGSQVVVTETCLFDFRAFPPLANHPVVVSNEAVIWPAAPAATPIPSPS